MPSKRKVKCIETGIIYDSSVDAAKAMGLKSESSIRKCCVNPKKIGAGYHWEWYTDKDLPNEIWRYMKHLNYRTDIIEDFNNEYEVSNKGRVRRSDNHSIINGTNVDGYRQVKLNDKKYAVHRLVASTFIPNDDPLNKIEVNHIEEMEKSNNCVENLEWCTTSYNINYGTRNERTSKALKNNTANKREVLCTTTGERFKSIVEASEKYNIDRSCIGRCCSGKYEQAGGYHWISIEEDAD